MFAEIVSTILVQNSLLAYRGQELTNKELGWWKKEGRQRCKERTCYRYNKHEKEKDDEGVKRQRWWKKNSEAQEEDWPLPLNTDR